VATLNTLKTKTGLAEAERLAHELSPGTAREIRWGRIGMTRSAAYARRNDMSITISPDYWAVIDDDERRQLIAHELAHLLDDSGMRRHHNRVWRAHARRLGDHGNRCHKWASRLPGRGPRAPQRREGAHECPGRFLHWLSRWLSGRCGCE
jgi:predicted SprT family Zn-dependent metalloprotease